MTKKNLILTLVLLAAVFCWTMPAVALADDGIIELPEDEGDRPLLDPDGLSADPQTFDVEVWNGRVVEVSPDTALEGGFWSRFFIALEEMMQRIWEIASPR